MMKNIKSSINSILNQTLDDIEIICIDDESTDNSFNILKNFSKKDNRIRVFTQENQGSGKARNKGLSEVKGEYVAFLDSDDYIVDETSFSKLYDEAKKYDMEMVSVEYNLSLMEMSVMNLDVLNQLNKLT